MHRCDVVHVNIYIVEFVENETKKRQKGICSQNSNIELAYKYQHFV